MVERRAGRTPGVAAAGSPASSGDLPPAPAPVAHDSGRPTGRRGHGEDLSFGALRRLGIELAQQLAADSWTDYNVHDPGVTLLEQLCFALTDLIHRAEFQVADHLTGPDGIVDFDRLGLELPERIFPCRPTTLLDYRRIIIDRVPKLDDVWIEPVVDEPSPGSIPQGLYRILLRSSSVTEADRGRIRSAVERVYGEHRNLCEDVHEISFVDEIGCVVIADVEVERGRPPDETLAEIYHRCAEHISARVRIHPYEQIRRSGLSLADAFTGPLERHGFCDQADLERAKRSHAVSEFFSLINGLDGVDYIRDLHFQVRGKIERDSIGTASAHEALRLHIPQNPDQVQVKLSSHGQRLRVSFEAFRRGLDALALKGSATERAYQDVGKLYTEPHGEYRELSQYTSVQAHLPPVYGVGAHRPVGPGAAHEWARSRQLKGYLLLFDQLLANAAAQIASLRELYSRDPSGPITYFSQLLDDSQIAGLEEIYPLRPAAAIGAILARYDNVADRKGRLLDYLLALYGEAFNQNSLRTFDYYATAEEREQALLDNRARFLRAIVELSGDRGAAMDYRQPERGTVSGLQHRVGILLGLTDHRRKSLTAAFEAHGLRPVADDQIAAPRGAAKQPSLWDSVDYRLPDDPWQDEVVLDASGAGQSLSQLMARVGDLLPRHQGRIGESLLSNGLALAGYRLGHLESDASWQAFLVPEGEDAWWRLGSFPSRQEAMQAVNQLRRLIVLLNSESEGMHVVEHILLRPRCSAAEASGEATSSPDFFAFRLSLVFPVWTARFRDRRFRQLVKETVRLNCPAHLVPQVYWLGFADMLEFEALQQNWLRCLAHGEVAPSEIDGAAGRLRDFLLVRGGEDCWASSPRGEDRAGLDQ